MRTAVFVGLVRIAISIKPLSIEAQNVLFWVVIVFIIADLIEFIVKLARIK